MIVHAATLDPSQETLQSLTTITLDRLAINQSAVIIEIDSHAPIADATSRLMEMGLIPGATVKVVRRAPLGDPISIWVHGYHLSLRKSEARSVLIEPTPTPAYPS
jgi:ferrous iron transport protein A